MRFNKSIFRKFPLFEGETFKGYPNERAMLRNAVADLNFICWLWLLACGYDAPKEDALLLLVELRRKGEPLHLNLNVIYSWLQILGGTQAIEAKPTVYNFNDFLHILYESLNEHVPENPRSPKK